MATNLSAPQFTASVGKLERVALREVWRHEAYDFTCWLEDNIDVLNDELDLNLVSVEREQAAGPFSVDLVAEDEDGTKFVIENQLEKSNHDHLGKLLTYLVAMDAKAAIWIVSEPRPEHVSVVAWLNESSSADFYLVKVEAVRIGDSLPAPLLTTIVGPSIETEAIARSKREFSERGDLRRKWWARLLARPDNKLHRHLSIRPALAIGVSSGVRGFSFNYVVRQSECDAQLYIDLGEGEEEQTKELFDLLHQNKEKIEASFGGELEWQRLPERRACRIRKAIRGGNNSPEEEWDSIQERQVDAMNRLHAALRPFLKSLPQ